MRKRVRRRRKKQRRTLADLETALDDLQYNARTLYTKRPEVLVNALFGLGALCGGLLFVACISGFRGALELIFEGGLLTVILVIFFASTGAAFYLRAITQTELLEDEPDSEPYHSPYER